MERREKRVRRRKAAQRIAAAVICCAMVVGLLLQFRTPANAAVEREVVADASTMYTWREENYMMNTRNVGRIWTDKSVFTEDTVTLEYAQQDYAAIDKTPGAEFLVALSALSSTSTKTTNVSVPLDIVMVLDVSSSMDSVMSTYNPVYGVGTSGTYYVYANGQYRTVSYSDNNRNWGYTTGWGMSYNRTVVTPMTSAEDTDPDHTQFYTRTQQSRLNALKQAAVNFVNATSEANESLPVNQQHQISVVSFDTTATVETALTTNTTTLINKINGLRSRDDTHPGTGMTAAANQFSGSLARQNAKKVVIMFTDGNPAPRGTNDFSDSLAWDAISAARDMKADDTLIYSIAVYEGADPANTTEDMNKYLHAVSSNYQPTGTNWSNMVLGERVKDSDFYKTATDAAELDTIFHDIFDEISTSAVAPTHVETSGAPEQGGYVTFTDTTGAFMEVKGFNAIVYRGEAYIKQGNPVVNADGKVTYAFTDEVTGASAAYPGNYSLSNILITVTPGTAANGNRQVVKVQIPAALLPLRLYDVDADGVLTITEDFPVRVFYSVGLREDVAEAMESGRFETVDGLTEYVQAHTINGKTHFFSNYWEHLSHSETVVRGDTTSAFTPATTNNFYFYTTDTPLYVKNGENYENLKKAPTNGQELFYQYTHYAVPGAEENPIVNGYVSVTYNAAANSNSVAVDANGNYYIKAGTPKIRVSNATNFQDPKPENDQRVSNPTESATHAIYPTWSSGESVNYLGNNGRINYTATGSLAVSKTVTADEGLTAPDAEFTFEVALIHGTYEVNGTYATKLTTAGSADETEGTLTITNGTGTIILKKNQTLTIYGLPEGTGYTVTEKNIPAGFEQTLPENNAAVTAGPDDAATTNVVEGIRVGVTAEAKFNNHYSVEPFKQIQANYPTVVKHVRDKDWTGTEIEKWHDDWQFTFFIRPVDSAPAPKNTSVTIDRLDANNVYKAAFDFSDVTFTKPGTYLYTISELKPQSETDRLAGINYSSASYRLEIKISDNGDGTLSCDTELLLVVKDDATAVQDDVVSEEAVFNNVYALGNVVAGPEATKVYTDSSNGRSMKAGDFQFTITPIGDNAAEAPLIGNVTPGTTVTTVTNTLGGFVEFGSATFEQKHVGQTFVYEMREVIPEDGKKIPGMIYDDTVYTAEVTVSEKKTASGDAVAINVVYKKDGQVISIDPDRLLREQLVFENSYKPEPAVLSEADGTALKVQKTLDGRNLFADDNFTFKLESVNTLRADEAVPMPASSTATVVINGDGTKNIGTKAFGEIIYDKVGVYTYKITETKGSLGGVTYDTHEAYVTVTVELDESTGKLVASVAYNNNNALTEADRAVTEAAAFTNTYKPSPVTMTPSAIKVSKTLEGTPWIATDQFTFVLIPDNTNGAIPMPNTANARILDNYPSVAGKPETKSVFFDETPLVYSKEGTYTYYIAEVPGTIPGITYDRYVYKFVVTISDPGNGQLEVLRQTLAKSTTPLAENAAQDLATVEALTYGTAAPVELNNPEYLGAEFTNVYKAAPTAAVSLNGIKQLIGRAANAGEVFSFELKHVPQDGEAVNAVTMPANTTVTISNAVRGYNPFAFGGIVFNEPGTYTFTINEVVPAEGADPLMRYDDHICTVTVTIVDDLAAGQLKLAAENGIVYSFADNTGEGAANLFINHYYNPKDAKDVSDGTTTIDGEVVSAGQQLTYTISWENIENTTGSVEIIDTIPANTVYVSGDATTVDLPAGASVESFTNEGGVLTWKIVNVPAHGRVTVTLTVEVSEDYVADTDSVITNKAAVNGVETNETTNYLPGKTVENETGATPNTVQVGDILTYTIRYFNSSKTDGTVVITDKLAEALDFVKDSAYVGGDKAGTDVFEYDEATRTLTWTIPNVPALGSENYNYGTVSFQARVNEKALNGGATNYATVDNKYTTNVITLPAPGSASLTITKNVDNPSGAVLPAEIGFTVQVELKDSKGVALTGEYPWHAPNTGATGTIKSGGTLILMDGGKYVITGLPQGATYTVTEINLPNGFAQTVPADNKPAVGTIQADVSAEQTPVNLAAFVNGFTPAVLDGSTYLQVGKGIWTPAPDSKQVHWQSGWSFTFHLTALKGAPLPKDAAGNDVTTVTLTADSTKGTDNPDLRLGNFGNINFTKEDIYEYIIHENRASSIPAITFSQAAFRVTVEVTADTKGNLSISNVKMVQFQDFSGASVNVTVYDSASQDKQPAVFHNLYILDKEIWTPTVFKGYKDNSNANAPIPPFTFKVEPLRGYVTAAPDVPKTNIPVLTGQEKPYEAANDGAGKMTFGSATFGEDHVNNTYEYLIYEDIPASASSDTSMKYDDSRYIVRIEVKHETAKDLEGKDVQAVVLYVKYYPAEYNGTEWVVNAEAAPLTANGPTFNNEFTPVPGETQFTVSKTISGRNWIKNDDWTDSFSFVLRALRGTDTVNQNIEVPMPGGQVGGTANLTITAGKDNDTSPQTAVFDKIIYQKVGTYWYEVSEVIPTDKLGGMTYDEHEHVIKVVVEEKEGKLIPTVTYYASMDEVSAAEPKTTENAAFTNTYVSKSATLASDKLNVYKSLEGRGWRTGDSFTFTIEGVEKDGVMPPMPALKNITIDSAVKAIEGVSFGEVTYHKAGVYTYTITEETKPATPIPGVNYDTSVYTVIVTVTDDYLGELHVDYAYKVERTGVSQTDAPSLIFTNSYLPAPAKEVYLNVTKVLNGRAWKADDSFAFKLVPINNAPMPVIDTVNVTEADQKVPFGPLVFAGTGTYQYKIVEVKPATLEENMTYDGHECIVTVVVTDDGAGVLKAAVSYEAHANDKGAAVFTNVYYDPEKAKDVTDGSISIDGKPVSAGQELTYVIEWANTVGMTANVVITDTFPAGTTPVTGSTKITGYDAAPLIQMNAEGTTATWTLTNVPIGAMGTLSFKVKVNSTDLDGAEVKNQAVVNGNTTNITVNQLPGKTVNTDEAKLGVPVVYTITYWHAGKGADVTITDTLDERLDFVEGSAKVDGAAPAEGVFKFEASTLTWKITAGKDDAAGWRTVSFQARPNVNALKEITRNKAVIDYGNGYTVETNVVELSKIKTADLSVTKVIALAPEQGTVIDATKEFFFKVELTDANDKPLTEKYVYTINGGAAGEVENGSVIKLKHGETAVISALPVGTKYTITEMVPDPANADAYIPGVPAGYTADAQVKAGALSSTAGAAETFTNTYSVAALIETVLEAMKTLNGPDGIELIAGEFSFGVYTTVDGTEPVATGTNVKGSDPVAAGEGMTSSGEVIFSKINFKAAGTYTFYIRENAGTAAHIHYDPTIYVATVKIKDNGNGTLSVESVSYSLLSGEPVEVPPVFTNKVDPGTTQVQVPITAIKKFTGWDNVDGWTMAQMAGKFTFAVYDSNGKLKGTATNDENGNIIFNDIIIDTDWSGEYTFTLKEITGDLGGVTYDNKVYTVKVNVVMQNQALVAEAPRYYDAEGTLVDAASVVFENKYTGSATGEVIIEGNKAMFNRDLAAEEFSFKYTVTDAGGNPVNGKSGIVKNTANGKFSINLGVFDTVGVYTVTIEEAAGSDNYVLYDDNKFIVTVTVTDDGSGKLKYKAEYSQGIAFTNYYMTPAPLVLTAKKELTGDRVLAAGEFTFDYVVKDAAGNPVPGKSGTVKNAADGTITIDLGTFDTVGDYVATITEVDGKEIGMEYDTVGRVVNIKVTRDVDNKLKAEAVYPNGIIVFQNKYTKPEPISVPLKVTKKLNGRDLVDGEFTFIVKYADGELAGQIAATGKSKADGTVAFDKELKFDKAGTYKFTVEEDKTTNPIIGVTYDPAKPYEVEVKVELLDTNKLSAKVTYPGNADGIVFTNTYTAPSAIKVYLEGKKELTGREMADNEFSFVVKYAEGALKDQIAATGKNNAAKEIIFEAIEFTAPGTYKFIVEEDRTANPIIGVTYDLKSYPVVVVVDLSKDNELIPTVEYPNGEIIFRNLYQAPKAVPVILEGTKELTGRDMVAGEFEFVVKHAEGALKDVVVATGKNDADKKIIFEPISFTEDGSYKFIVEEIKGSHIGTAYDNTKYEVTVDVTLQPDNTLKAEVKYPQSGLAFHNQYTKPVAVPVSLKAVKLLEGRGLDDGEFTFQVTDENGNVLANGTNSKDGSILFDEILFDKAGVYYLTVKEVEGDDGRITYDDAAFVVEVTVALTDDNKLVPTVKYPEGGITFTNTYHRPPEPPKEPEIIPGTDTSDTSGTGLFTALGFFATALVWFAIQWKRRLSRIHS